jgi:hypothetical protein
MAHTHFTLVTQAYKHTLIICNTYFFSTATSLHERSSTLHVNDLPLFLLLTETHPVTESFCSVQKILGRTYSKVPTILHLIYTRQKG